MKKPAFVAKAILCAEVEESVGVSQASPFLNTRISFDYSGPFVSRLRLFTDINFSRSALNLLEKAQGQDKIREVRTMLNLGFRCIVPALFASIVLTACQTDGPTARGADGKIPDPVSTLPRVPQPTVSSLVATTSVAPVSAPSNDDNIADIDVVVPPTTTSTTLPPALPPPNSQFSDLKLGFEQISPIEKVTGIAWLGDVMFASTQPGPIFKIDGETTEVALDLTADTHRFQPGSERGVLGVAIDPRDQRLFVNYTDQNDDTLVVSYEMDNGVAVLDSRREVLFIDQPGLGHNGGRLHFDRLGNLLISSGDGGGSNGWDAQDTSKLLGAILRVTPNLDSPGYSIPLDNPNADGISDRPEVLARGFRNPWSFAVDEPTGEIWIGDVGNKLVEELSVLRRVDWGGNFGWPYFEGNTRKNRNEPADLVFPVYDYGHDVGVAVMAGFPCRGCGIPELDGAVLFGDMSGPIWAIGSDGVSRLDAERVYILTGWAKGPDNSLYALAYDGIFRVVKR